MKTARFLVHVFAIGAILAAGASPAFAALSNTLGAGAKATSYGGAFTAIADDFTASYYNPAGLATVKHRELVSGWLFGHPNVNLGQWGAYNDLLSGPILGNVFPFEILGMKASLGIYSFYPQHGAGVINIHSAPWNFNGACNGNCTGQISPGGGGVQLRIPRRLPSSVYISSDNQQHLDFITALGLKLHDKLYVGAGVRANVKILGDVDAPFVQTSKGAGALAPTPLGAGTFTGQIAARPTFGWILGMLFDTGKGVKLGASWKQETGSIFRQGLNSQATLPTTGDLSIVIPVRGQLNLDTAFQPQEATIGVAWDINDRWTVTADFTWEDWSRYNGNTLRADFQGVQSFEVPPNQGQTGQGNIVFEPRPMVDAHDIFIPRVGIQYQIKRVWRIRAGWARIPSVMGDPQGGLGFPLRDVNKNIIGYATDESNFADSDKQIWSFGMGLEQDDPFEWFELPQTIDVTYQYVQMQGKTFSTLDTNNPFGNFHLNGNQWTLMLTNTARF